VGPRLRSLGTLAARKAMLPLDPTWFGLARPWHCWRAGACHMHFGIPWHLRACWPCCSTFFLSLGGLPGFTGESDITPIGALGKITSWFTACSSAERNRQPNDSEYHRQRPAAVQCGPLTDLKSG